MATTITYNAPTDDDTRPIIQTQAEHHYLLGPPAKIFKPLPPTIIQSIETERQQRHNQVSRSTVDIFLNKESSVDTTDDDLDETNRTLVKTPRLPRHQRRLKLAARARRSPSDIRVTLYPDENASVHEGLTLSQSEVSSPPERENELRQSDPSLTNGKSTKPNATDYIRRTLLDHRFSRRIHSSFSSSTTLRSLSRRRSTEKLSPRSSTNPPRNRRHPHHLPRNSKWHIVRHRLHDIAMMSDSYARMKVLEQDLRWVNLREKIRAQVFDIREMNLLRQQDDGLVAKKKTQKTRFDLKNIPVSEVVHVERDGRVFSMSTRDLVLGRLLDAEDIQLDTFAQLDARRQFQVQQHLLKQQEGRTRLKKHIAFSFCLCNLSFIVLMFAAMFIFAMKTILELRSRQFR
ncbi:unnamed protein product [Adineta ricciae]|uniref:Uncharacterized protein n=1 Tax=Adineta ricciae TaxID=249248 RepID=A0A815B0B4_ADIRI|nr:unnamed protein product [Adineta ricciae]CAF1479074.1 unnamed protein product [Adineta ricciae]